LRLPEKCSASFHDPDSSTGGRFARGTSILPPVDGGGVSGWRIRFVNYSLRPLKFQVGIEGAMEVLSLESGQSLVRDLMTRGRELVIESETFIPSQVSASSDERCLGVYLDTAQLL
jgi:hypothetical protein